MRCDAKVIIFTLKAPNQQKLQDANFRNQKMQNSLMNTKYDRKVALILYIYYYI